MTKIYKFELDHVSEAGGLLLSNDLTITSPGLPIPLHLERQGAWLCLWARVDERLSPRVWRVFPVGTGHPIPDGSLYLGTVLDGDYVWHYHLAQYKKDQL